TRPLDARHPVLPPALLVRLWKGPALRQPHQDVIVRTAALREFENPRVATGETRAGRILPQALQKLRDLLSDPALAIAVRQRQHGPPTAKAAFLRFLDVQPRRGDDVLLHLAKALGLLLFLR